MKSNDSNIMLLLLVVASVIPLKFEVVRRRCDDDNCGYCFCC